MYEKNIIILFFDREMFLSEFQQQFNAQSQLPFVASVAFWL